MREVIRSLAVAIVAGFTVLAFSYKFGTAISTGLIIWAIVVVVAVWLAAEAIQTPRVRAQLKRPFSALDNALGQPRLVRKSNQPPTPEQVPEEVVGPERPPPSAKAITTLLQRHIQARRHLWILDELAIVAVSEGGDWDVLRDRFIGKILDEGREMIMPHIAVTERRLGFLECVDSNGKFTPGIKGQQPPAHHHLRLVIGPGLTGLDIPDVEALGNERGLANQAILSGENEEEPDCKHPQSKFMPAGHRVEIGAMLCVPARIGKKVVGVISADSPIKGAFSQIDTQTMTELATKIALAYATAPPGGQPLRP